MGRALLWPHPPPPALTGSQPLLDSKWALMRPALTRFYHRATGIIFSSTLLPSISFDRDGCLCFMRSYFQAFLAFSYLLNDNLSKGKTKRERKKTGSRYKAVSYNPKPTCSQGVIMYLSCHLVTQDTGGPHSTAGKIHQQAFSPNDARKFLEGKRRE